MGYRLAAAGPRTRQRLMDRETPPPERPAPPAAPAIVEDRLPALSAWDDAAWERRISGEPEPALARLSVERNGFPVWRAAALLASAACGFSLVLWGQSLHLDRKPRNEAARDMKPVSVAAQAPDASAPAAAEGLAAPARHIDALSTLPALERPTDQAAAATKPDLVVSQADHPAVIAAASVAAPDAAGEPAAPLRAPTAVVVPAAPAHEQAAAQPSAAKPAHWAAALPAPARHAAPPQSAEKAHAPSVWPGAAAPRPPSHHAAVVRLAMAEADPRQALPKPRVPARIATPRYELPHWLTENHPEHAPQVIMSPQPHDLEPPPGSETAESSPPPVRTAQAALPPIPQPQRRPRLVYAEAHDPPPPPSVASAHPYYNSLPYYGPYQQTYGYYGAMPRPSPYGEP